MGTMTQQAINNSKNNTFENKISNFFKGFISNSNKNNTNSSQTSPISRGGAIYVDFPDYQVETSTVLGKMPLGHGLVIAVDEKGRTRGSEYGRYDKENKGIARRVRVPDFKFSGQPTEEEMNAYAEALDKVYGHSFGKTHVTYVNNADYNKMIQLMESAEKNNRKDSFYTNKDYCLAGHNCGTYGIDIINQAIGNINSNVKGTPSSIRPKGVSGEYSRKI